MAKILIVEDEETLRNVLADKLKSEDFEVLEASNGEEGLTSAQSNEPDLILLDILMPVMDGFTMTEKLRQSEKESGKQPSEYVPIIFLTNLGEEKGLTQSQKHGVYNYLVKSNWKLENVVIRIKEVLKTHQQKLAK